MMGFVSLDFPYFPTLMVTASSPTHSSAAYRCIDRLLQLSLPAQLDFLGPLMPSISTHGSHMLVITRMSGNTADYAPSNSLREGGKIVANSLHIVPSKLYIY
ncbi:uncharacterized protein FPRO_00004 [Fusarium proliferatum ET1]|uniref:Uncharacterized protein n=1 Tax=Fusarium proliferatum (strain ET1) TaxID=1227346 RepID=A0A1L7V4R0_FUSPR|nr:uncharacterized protein FPRO_00004 [Fusarium proliferatum ET1]CZR35873.1 uncharacterized protein FPRO_00004 [Fusarium proliferatum ET1]